MRVPNDRILAQHCQDDVDLILGGHDHSSLCENIGKVTLVKSGTDFEEFSHITVDMTTREATRKKVLITNDFAPDIDMTRHVM